HGVTSTAGRSSIAPRRSAAREDETTGPRPAPARRTTGGRGAGPELGSGQQVTVRWNGSSVASGGAAVMLRVMTVTVLLSAPSCAVAVAGSVLLDTVAPSAHFEM